MVFVDTNVIEAANFGLRGPLLSALVSHGRKGNLALLLPGISLAEWQTRLRAQFEEAERALQSARTKAKILRVVTPSQVDGLFACTDLAPLCAIVEKEFADIAKESWVIDPPIPSDAVARVLSDYFLRRPPFDLEGKRYEFVDAFVLDCLRAYAESSGEPITVVSKDNDLRRYCATQPRLKHTESLADVLAELTKEEIATQEFVTASLEREADTLQDWARSLLEDVRFTLADVPGEVDIVRIRRVDWDDGSVIDVDGEDVIVSLRFHAHIEAGISVGHPADPTAYQDWIERDVTIPASLRMSLHAKKVDIPSLELDTGGHIEIRARGRDYR